jgi:hypothetical protein
MQQALSPHFFNASISSGLLFQDDLKGPCILHQPEFRQSKLIDMDFWF